MTCLYKGWKMKEKQRKIEKERNQILRLRSEVK